MIKPLAFDIFHDEIRDAVRRDRSAVEPRNVGMGEAGQDSFLLLKTPDNVDRTQAEFEKLDCHFAA